jgi:hypothetical protein
MWDQIPPANYVFRRENFYDKWHEPPARILYFPGWRLMRYLPLQIEGSRLYGITAFCDGLGILGLRTHFQDLDTLQTKMSQVGSDGGCPVHFRMQSDEYITYVWVIYRNSSAFPPMLMVCHSFQEN